MASFIISLLFSINHPLTGLISQIKTTSRKSENIKMKMAESLKKKKRDLELPVNRETPFCVDFD